MSKINASTGDRAIFAPPSQFSFLRIPVVLNRRGVSRSAHYADIKAGLFPSPVAIGLRAVAHPDYEVDALNAATIAGRSADEIRALVLRLEAARKAAK
jgi:prophage regulatory protein